MQGVEVDGSLKMFSITHSGGARQAWCNWCSTVTHRPTAEVVKTKMTGAGCALAHSAIVENLAILVDAAPHALCAPHLGPGTSA